MKIHARTALAAASFCAVGAFLSYVALGGSENPGALAAVEARPGAGLQSAETGSETPAVEMGSIEARASGDILNASGGLRRGPVGPARVLIDRRATDLQVHGIDMAELATLVISDGKYSLASRPWPAIQLAVEPKLTSRANPSSAGAVNSLNPLAKKGSQTQEEARQLLKDHLNNGTRELANGNGTADRGQESSSASPSADEAIAPGGPQPAARRAWPRGNYSPELQLYRSQIGWEAFDRWVREETLAASEQGPEAAPKR